METSEQIFRLLYSALIEIRTEAYEKENTLIFCISDMFHTVPLQLERVQKGEISYAEVFSDINKKASEKGYEKLLENLLDNAMRK